MSGPLSLLFKPGESVCAGGKFAVDPVRWEDVAANPTAYEYITVNPIHTRRADANCTAFRNFLFEVDDGSSIEEQMRWAQEIKLPYTTATYSGGKSVHFVLSLRESLRSADHYQAFAGILRAAQAPWDPSCFHPTRFTRVPGGRRQGVPVREQTLLDVRGSQEFDGVRSWALALPRTRQFKLATGETASPEAAEAYAKKLIASGPPADGRKRWLFHAGCALLRAHMDPDALVEGALKAGLTLREIKIQLNGARKKERA